MDTKQLLENERKQYQRLINFRLPSSFYRIGLVLSILAVLLLLVRPYLELGSTSHLKTALHYVILISLLMMSLSKDRIEDEMIIGLRAKSYSFAFICGVLYALVMPYLDFGVSSVLNQNESFEGLGDFHILFFMLVIQLLVYRTFKCLQ